MENTALVRKTYDDADDAIWFDPATCTLDEPGIDADRQYVFVDPADAVPRVFLTAIAPREVPVGTTSVTIPVTGTIYPAQTEVEWSHDGASWSPLETDTQTRIDGLVSLPLDGSLGEKTLTLRARPINTTNTVSLPLTVHVVV